MVTYQDNEAILAKRRVHHTASLQLMRAVNQDWRRRLPPATVQSWARFHIRHVLASIAMTQHLMWPNGLDNGKMDNEHAS